jgi:hypothetical protein
MRKTLPRRLKNLIDVGRTHIEMSGYVAAVRAALSKLIAPKYDHERFDATHGVDTHPWTLADSQIPPETIGEAIHYEPAHRCSSPRVSLVPLPSRGLSPRRFGIRKRTHAACWLGVSL